MDKRLRILALFTIGCLYLLVGILKWKYILNPGIAKGSFLLDRYSSLAQQNYNQDYSDSFRYFLFTPKWISTLLFGNLFLAMNLIVIYLVYQNQMYIRFTFWLFFWVSVLSVGVLALGFLSNTYLVVYPIVSRIKELQQSPFTLLLLLGAFTLHVRQEPT